ncbi:MAG: hypothetical protein COT84_05640 [Chlamydiae bacterium CG10_big_fil_rev_8_21_14_0_10_35_9]|nr:MAG: hypothetical protein COT84_05640 [Chlamydiae bacterium CG10_big_fil_rev_8_21_14_0_10_35_9]
MTVSEFLTNPIGLSFILILRMILSSIFLCSGIGLFDFKKLHPFFTLKRIVSFFLVIFGSRLLVSAIFFFNIG